MSINMSAPKAMLKKDLLDANPFNSHPSRHDALTCKRIEVRISVVNIFIFCALQCADSKVGEWGHQGFDADLENVVGDRKREEQTPRENAERRCDSNKRHSVYQFTDERAPSAARSSVNR